MLSTELSNGDHCSQAIVERVSLFGKSIAVVRDDLLPGGTKQRGLVGMLRDFRARGVRRFVYASPFCGYAQVALSYLCGQMGLECELYCEIDPTSASSGPHEYTKLAQGYGAKVYLCQSLEAAKRAAEHKARIESDVTNIPLGFDCVEFNHHYRNALELQWQHVRKRVPNTKSIGLSVGSGTLLRNFAAVLAHSDIQINGVNVHVLNKDDKRIAGLLLLPNVKLFSARMKFAESSSELPPFPSNVHYDAKIAEFIGSHGHDDDVWWNVAR